MGGLEFNTLPATNTDDPFTVLDTKLTQLNASVKIGERALKTRRMTDKDFANEMYNLQDKYSAGVNALKQLRSNLMQVQSLVSQNKISKDEGNKAMWRMVLPEETSRAMFPTAVGEDVIPPSQLTSEVQKRAIEYSDAARGWGSKNQRDLVPQYIKFRNRTALVFGAEGYENLSNIQRKQIDAEWDLVQEDKGNEWNPRSPEIATMRTTGTLGRAASKLVSPIAASVQEERLKGPSGLKFSLSDIVSTLPWNLGKQPEPNESQTTTTVPSVAGKQLDTETAKSILMEAGGDRNKARILARQRGYQF
jgi:hypothetical protein